MCEECDSEQGDDVPDNQAGDEITDSEIIGWESSFHMQGVLHEQIPYRGINRHPGIANCIDDAHPSRSNFKQVLCVDRV